MVVATLHRVYGEERKVVRNGRPIISALGVASPAKLESFLLIVTQNEPGNNGDDCERCAPYRQREGYAVRKTQWTNADSIEKPIALRNELEFPRGLLNVVQQR
jgi:hypothetical protein